MNNKVMDVYATSVVGDTRRRPTIDAFALLQGRTQW